MRPRHVIMPDGRAYDWRAVLAARRQQLADARREQQPALFHDLADDSRPAHQRTAASRYTEPTLFDGD